MQEYVNKPFNEELHLFSAEEKYLNQEPNEALYYVNGSVIVRSDGGDYLFYSLPEDDKEFFAFGSQLEADNLQPIAALDAESKQQLHSLMEMNGELNPKGIAAVSLEKEKENGQNVYYAVIVNPKHSENTYFRIAVPDLQKLDHDRIDELLTFNEERNLDNPYRVQFEGDLMLAY